MLKAIAGSLTLAAIRSPLPEVTARTLLPLLRGLHPRIAGRPRPRDVRRALQAFVGPLSSRDAGRLSRRLDADALRTFLLRYVHRLGQVHAALPMVRWSDDGGLAAMHREARAAIVLFFHVGPPLRTGLALEQLGIRPLVLAARPFRGGSPDISNAEWLTVGRAVNPDPGDRGLSLKRALTRLTQGGIVAISVDGPSGEAPLHLPFFGRERQFGRGAAVLARLSGAPLVPVIKSWSSDHQMDFRSYAPLNLPRRPELGPEAADRAATAAIVAWFEAHLRTAPAEFRLQTIWKLWRAPVMPHTDPQLDRLQ